MNHVAVQTIEDQHSNDLDRIISTTVGQFFDAKEYRVWNNDFSNDSMMMKTDLNAEGASAMVCEYGPQFVESVVVLKKHWFFMTSFSCFIHNNKQIDDCTDLSRVGHQDKAVALIRRKTRFGKDYFESTIRFGYVELLATSGFFGAVDGSFISPFLGSSVRELPVSITGSYQTTSTDVIFISIEQKEYRCKPRILNQYYKRHSTNDWGFYSKKFEDNNFSPANPLSFQNQNLMHTAASLVIKSFANQTISPKR